jgi:hypothetical protein
MPKFTHEFTDGSPEGTLSIDLSPQRDARIQAGSNEKGEVWIDANPKGWLHIARIAAELGMSNYEPGYHFHRDLTFGDSHDEGQPTLSFGVLEDK